MRLIQSSCSSILLCFLLLVALLLPRTAQGAERQPEWTVYLAQDKHLDYNWCGSTTEIELRMAARGIVTVALSRGGPQEDAP